MPLCTGHRAQLISPRLLPNPVPRPRSCTRPGTHTAALRAQSISSGLTAATVTHYLITHVRCEATVCVTGTRAQHRTADLGFLGERR